MESTISLYEERRLSEVIAVKKRLADSLRDVNQGVIKPVLQSDATKVRPSGDVIDSGDHCFLPIGCAFESRRWCCCSSCSNLIPERYRLEPLITQTKTQDSSSQ